MMHTQVLLTAQQIDGFISRHRLPAEFRNLIEQHYSPLASWLTQRRIVGKTMFIGINGAQGTGKSTLADFLRMALEFGADWRVGVLSIDDFYLTKTGRRHLAESVHPLLVTRGVPGTHDLNMLSACIEKLENLGEGEELKLPRFDKARDDRAETAVWPVIAGPVDLIILEGWCVGSRPQSAGALIKAINSLEEEQDASGEWRRHVNDQLAGDYAKLFERLDALVFLRAPSFDAVYRWRLEQEEKLALAAPDNSTGIMNEAQIAGFIQHYERITRANLGMLPGIADVVLELDNNHHGLVSRYT